MLQKHFYSAPRFLTGHVWANLSLCLILSALFVAGTAEARPGSKQKKETLQRAKEAWRQGQSLFNRGDYIGAREQFTKGYELTHKSGFLFNIASCENLLGNKEQAKYRYMEYLRKFPRGKFKDEVEKQCQSLGLGDCEKKAAAPIKPNRGKEILASKPISDVQSAKGHQTDRLLIERKATHESESSKPFYKHWGFYAGVGAAIIAGTVTAVVLATRGSSDSPTPDLTFDFSH